MIGGAGMLPINLDLTESLAAKLREIRLNNPIDGEILTAENLSKAIGNNRAWMSQIESRRLKKIRREDIIKIYRYLYNTDDRTSEEKAESDLRDFIIYKVKLSDIQRKLIRTKRKQSGMRCDDLSLEIGKGKAYISQIESGKITSVSKDILQTIANKLNCNIEEFIGKEDDCLKFEIDNNNRDIKDVLSENIILRQENEMLKRKLQSIMEIINM